jgi:hypothetical protein
MPSVTYSLLSACLPYSVLSPDNKCLAFAALSYQKNFSARGIFNKVTRRLSYLEFNTNSRARGKFQIISPIKANSPHCQDELAIIKWRKLVIL